MLTGLFFLAGVVAFVYLCWWAYINDREGKNLAPRLGLLAMTTLADVSDDAKRKKVAAWKRRGKSGVGPAVRKPPRRVRR